MIPRRQGNKDDKPNSFDLAGDGLFSSAKDRPRINLKNAAFLPANVKQMHVDCKNEQMLIHPVSFNYHNLFWGGKIA